MPRPWQRGPGRRYLPLALVALAVLGLGWIFGSRIYLIQATKAELHRLQAQQAAIHEDVFSLRRELAAAALSPVIEREARLRLRWGFPDEERIVILRR